MADGYDPLSYENLAASVVRALMDREAGPLPPPERFKGAGVYAIYYLGGFAPYARVVSPDCAEPIYVGKADPPGARRGAPADDTHTKLRDRLREHARSIRDAVNLELSDFMCRYLVVQPVWIRLAEQFLIQHFQPIWNCVIDGFGSHVPGSGRPGTRSSHWDMLHPRDSRTLHGQVEAERNKVLAELDKFLSRSS
jgi:hypothetical protein